MSSPLSNLITMICSGAYVSKDAVAQVLEEKYGYILPIEEGVERFFCEHDLVEGVELLVDSRRAIVRMAQDAGDACHKDTSMSAAIRRLLQRLGLPLPPDSNQPLGAAAIKFELGEIYREVDEILQADRMDSHHLRSFPLDGWTYIEQLLKSTVLFYASILTGIDEQLKRKFDEARKKRELRPVLQAMRGIKNDFDLALKKNDSTSKDMVGQVLRLTGRYNPFEGFDFDKYENDVTVQEGRNFYAHKVRQAVEIQGAEAVAKSLENTIKLVDDLITLKIAPTVIFPTAYGHDEHKREMLWFVTERDIGFISRKRRKYERRMFKRGAVTIQLLVPHLTVSPLKGVLFDPPIVPYLQ